MHGARLPGCRRVCQPSRSASIFFCAGIPAWKQRWNSSCLTMHLSPPCALPQQTKAGGSGKTGKSTCCLSTCAALGSERALLHVGGKYCFPTRKGSPSFLLCLPPPKTSHCWGKTRLFVPGLLAAIPGAVLRVGGGDGLPSLQSQHKALQGFQPVRDGEVKAAVAMEIMHAQSSAVPLVPESSKTLHTHFVARPHCKGLAFPRLFLKTPLHSLKFLLLSCTGLSSGWRRSCVALGLGRSPLVQGSFVLPVNEAVFREGVFLLGA